MSDHRLDARGLLCPLPVLRAQKLLRGMAVGDRLTVEATDPSAPRDFAAFCGTTGHRLLRSETLEGVFVMTLEKAG